MKKILLLIVGLILFCLPANAIKIGLQDGINQTYIGCSVNANIIDIKTNKSLHTISGMKGYTFKPYRKNIAIKLGNDYFNLGTNAVTIRPIENGYLSVKGKWYRGFLMLYNKNGKLIVINNLGIEDYIKGVVPSEMPSRWNIEAQKAQAIAARSYALANLGKRANSYYDLKDTPEDQAYGGATAETEQTNNAVFETNGIVLIYGTQIIPAYYSASAGGKTVNSGNVWNTNLPYLRSVPSFDDGIKKNGHGVGMSQHGANNLAKQGYNAYQILQYFYKDIRFARINQDYYK